MLIWMIQMHVRTKAAGLYNNGVACSGSRLDVDDGRAASVDLFSGPTSFWICVLPCAAVLSILVFVPPEENLLSVA